MSLTSQSANASDPLGFDVFIGEDLDPSGRDSAGPELAMAALLHRLQADTILMTGAPNDEIDFGEDARKWPGEALTQEGLEAKLPRVEEVLRRDQRVAGLDLSIWAALADDASRWDIYLRAVVTFITGEAVDRIVGISDVTVQFLAEGK